MKIFIVGDALKSFAIEEKEVFGIDKYGHACYSIAKDDYHRNHVAEFCGFFHTTKESAEQSILETKLTAKKNISDYIELLKKQANEIDSNEFKLGIDNKEIAFAFGYFITTHSAASTPPEL